MHSLARAARSGSLAGTRLRLPFPQLNHHVDLRTKEIAVIAGAPGSGKSTLAISLTLGLRVPVMYVVQDSPASVMARFASNYLRVPVTRAHQLLQSRDAAAIERVEQLATPDRLVISGGAHSLKDIEEEMLAYTEWYGRGPMVVVLDNLVDTKSEKASSMEVNFYSDILLNLKQMAIRHDACFLVLHHVSRGGDGSERDMGRAPLKLHDLLFAGEREARHVWGVYNNGRNVLTTQILKQQDGRADPIGGHRIHLSWDPEYSLLTEIKHEE